MLFLIPPRIKDLSQKVLPRVVVLKFFYTLKSPGYSQLILLFQLIKPQPSDHPLVHLNWTPGAGIQTAIFWDSHGKSYCELVE